MDIFIITGKEIYSKDKSISFKFMFDCGIEFEEISEYDKYGMISKIGDRWFITAGKNGKHIFSGGIQCIKDGIFYDTVYLMKKSDYEEFTKEYGKDINHIVFHSEKILYQN